MVWELVSDPVVRSRYPAISHLAKLDFVSRESLKAVAGLGDGQGWGVEGYLL